MSSSPRADDRPGAFVLHERYGDPVVWLLGLAVTPYFVVRGWLTAAVVLFGLFSLIQLARRNQWSQAPVARPVAWLALMLAIPLGVAAIVQAVHGELIPRYFDAPTRLALGAALLLYLHLRRVDWLPVAQVALPVSVLLCAALLSWPGASQHYWDGARVASYFMDPLMLAQHAAIVGFMCLFLLTDAAARPPWLRLLQLAGVVAGIGISIATQSRTGWLMMPVLTALWLASFRRFNSPRMIALASVGVAAAAFGVYMLSEMVRMRVDDAVLALANYGDGTAQDTSVGIRLSLFRIAWAAFLEQPWFGWGFGALPKPGELAPTNGLWSDAVRHYFISAGVHNEWLQHMMYAGVLGIVSRAALLIAPLWFFGRAALRADGHQRLAGYLGLTLVIGYLSAGFTSEVFNLIYLSSFYALMVASLGAAALSGKPE